MARLKDQKSTRQLAFTALDGMSHLKRKEASAALVEQFDISASYAMTLFQNHRQDRSTQNKTGNGFVTIYKVRDTRSNSPVDPYMSDMVKNNPDKTEPRTKEDAISAYKKDNARKNKLATKLS